MLPQNRPQPREETKNKLVLRKIDFTFGWKSTYQSKILKFNVSSALGSFPHSHVTLQKSFQNLTEVLHFPLPRYQIKRKNDVTKQIV
jgi:hypothetical protein